jgi:putative transposase
LERVAQKRSKPRALVATGPDQIYCWDISYLPTKVRGMYFYLYLFVDLFSRQIVGWQAYNCDSATLASELLQAICERQGITANQLTVHSDNGSPNRPTFGDVGHERNIPLTVNRLIYGETSNLTKSAGKERPHF